MITLRESFVLQRDDLRFSFYVVTLYGLLLNRFTQQQGATKSNVSIGPSSLPSLHENDTHGGFEADFVFQLEDKHRCPVCLLALREPMQTNCGHRFCRSCIKQVTK